MGGGVGIARFNFCFKTCVPQVKTNKSIKFHEFKSQNLCNEMDNGYEQDLCMSSLFSVCFRDKVQYLDLEFSFFQNKCSVSS